MQASSKNLKKFSFNSVTMFSKTLHDDNILRVFDIKFKRRRLYNVNEFSFFDEKKQLSKKSAKVFTRSKKKEAKRKEKKNHEVYFKHDQQTEDQCEKHFYS